MYFLRGYRGIDDTQVPATHADVLEAEPLRDQSNEIFNLIVNVAGRLKLSPLIVGGQALHHLLEREGGLLLVIEDGAEHVGELNHLLKPLLMCLIVDHGDLDLLLSLLYDRLFGLNLPQCLNRQTGLLAPILQLLEGLRLLLLFLCGVDIGIYIGTI